MPLALLPFVFYNHMPRCGHPFAAPPDMITISGQTQTVSTETNRKWCLWNNSVNNCQNWWRRAPFPGHFDVHSPPLQLDGPWTSVGPCGLFYNCLDWDVCDRSYNLPSLAALLAARASSPAFTLEHHHPPHRTQRRQPREIHQNIWITT